MKIVDKRLQSAVSFDQLVNGDCFIDTNVDGNFVVEMKIEDVEIDGLLYNCIMLADGTLDRMYNDELVYKVEATLTIE